MSVALTLRRATRSDAAAIEALVDAAYVGWIPVIGHEPVPMTADYAQAVERHLIDVHEIDGQLAALIEMSAKLDHLLIVNVAVSPALQKRGLGRALMAHAEEIAVALGLRETRLYTNALMTRNIALYKSLGYTLSHQEPLRGGFVVHMNKAL